MVEGAIKEIEFCIFEILMVRMQTLSEIGTLIPPAEFAGYNLR